VDIASLGLPHFARGDGFGARQIKRWSEQYQSSIDRSAGGAIPSMDKVGKREGWYCCILYIVFLEVFIGVVVVVVFVFSVTVLTK
jgi:hypothetical protein